MSTRILFLSFLVSVLTVLISGPIGILFAYNGYGVWSLAIQQFSSNVLRVVLLWFFCVWRPSMTFSFLSLRQMFGYGSRLFASGLLDKIFQNIYLLVIGKLFSAVSLGHYTRALSLQQLPADVLTDIVGRVTFPLFSSMQGETERLRMGFKKIFVTLAFLTFPTFIGLVVIAEDLVIVLLTDKWLPCVPFLQLLALLGLMYPLHALHLNLLLALGRSDLFFRLEILKKFLVVIAIAITWSYGIEAMIVGQVVLTVLAYFLNSYFTNQLICYSLLEQMKDLIFPFILAFMMGLLVIIVSNLQINSIILLLAIQIFTGIIVYLILSYLFRPLGYQILMSILYKKNIFKLSD
jgi:O-antigen/teichoic acid export membrane protein